MGIAIYDILQLSIFNKFNLIAGNQGLTNNVRKVNVLDYEFDLAKKQGHNRCHFDQDSFVVTSMLFAKDDPGEIMNAVRYLIEDRASGLAIKNIYYQELSKEVTDLADKEGFPIFIFDVSAGPIEKIVTLINDRIRESESMEIREAKLKLLTERRTDPMAVKTIALELNPRFLEHCCAVYLKSRQHFTNAHLRHQIDYSRNYLPKNSDLFSFQGGLLVILTAEQPFDCGTIPKKINQCLYQCGIDQEKYYVAASTPHAYLSELDLCICEALYTMEYCELMQKSQENFSGLGIYQIIFPHLNDIWFFNFYHKIIPPILEYDEKYNGELLRTAQTFIRWSGNVGQTSQELMVHKNSIRYRLHKIQELCGLGAEHQDFYETLSMAIKLHLIFGEKEYYERNL